MPSLTINHASHSDAEKAYQLIKGKIISLELPPGLPINQQVLMEELGVSRTPVREALKRLENECLVVAIHRRGMSVAEIALNDLRHVYEIRVEMESACARLAAERASRAQLEQIDQLLTQLMNTDPHDRRMVAECERQLHYLIAECCHSRFLTKEVQHYYAMALRIWYFLIDRLPPGSEDYAGHKKVVEAIRNRDPSLAEQLMRAHVKEVFETVKVHL